MTVQFPTGSPFDAIKETDDDGTEIWRARRLQALMDYSQWKNLKPALTRGMASARNQGLNVNDEFREVSEVSGSRNLGDQEKQDFKLTRLAAYLVAMNGDPNKTQVAEAQAYFAIRTREAEVAPQEAQQIPHSFADALELAAKQARELEAAREQVDQLAPAAQAWSVLADAQGDYSYREASQVLNRDPAISTGEKRLAKYLRDIGWCGPDGQPYQRHVDNGRIQRRARTYSHPRTGEEQTTTQVRITAKGVKDLRDRMAGDGQLSIEGGP